MSSLVSTWVFESGQSKRVSLGLKTKSTKKAHKTRTRVLLTLPSDLLIPFFNDKKERGRKNKQKKCARFLCIKQANTSAI